jgi:hypothetical protein
MCTFNKGIPDPVSACKSKFLPSLEVKNSHLSQDVMEIAPNDTILAVPSHHYIGRTGCHIYG